MGVAAISTPQAQKTSEKLNLIAKQEADGKFGNGDIFLLVLGKSIGAADRILVRERETNEIELWKLHSDQSVTFHGIIALPFIADPFEQVLFPKGAGCWENIAWAAYDELR